MFGLQGSIQPERQPATPGLWDRRLFRLISLLLVLALLGLAGAPLGLADEAPSSSGVPTKEGQGVPAGGPPAERPKEAKPSIADNLARFFAGLTVFGGLVMVLDEYFDFYDRYVQPVDEYMESRYGILREFLGPFDLPGLYTAFHDFVQPGLSGDERGAALLAIMLAIIPGDEFMIFILPEGFAPPSGGAVEA